MQPWRSVALGVVAFVSVVLVAQTAPSTANSQSTRPKTPKIIAHRGGALESTENTIAAFQRAIRIGAAGIETDIRLTRDGVVVVYHDDRQGRVEGLPVDQSSPLISDLTYAELTARPLKTVGDDKGGRRVPTLEDLLKEVKSGLLNIELKRCERFDELVDKTIEIQRKSAAIDRVVLEPPNIPTAIKLRNALGPSLKLHINPGYDSSTSYDASVKNVIAFKPHSLSVSYKKLSWEIVDLAHKGGAEVWVWTVDSTQVASAMTLLGVDAIKTDLPTKMLEVVKKTEVH